MTLYIAVTPDHLELPLYVTESASDMAKWAGIKVATVKSSCSRNKRKPPLKPGMGINTNYRLRRITVEEE